MTRSFFCLKPKRGYKFYFNTRESLKALPMYLFSTQTKQIAVAKIEFVSLKKPDKKIFLKFLKNFAKKSNKTAVKKIYL